MTSQVEDASPLLREGMAAACAAGYRPVAIIAKKDLHPSECTKAQLSCAVIEIGIAPNRVLAANAAVTVDAASGCEIAQERPAAIVFPGSVRAFLELLADYGLTATFPAFVIEGGKWRRLTCMGAARASWSGHESIDSNRHRRALSWRSQLFEHSQTFRIREVARRLQPWLDESEHQLARLLHDGGNFPFRLTHVLESRVLIAIGTLASGGSERQVVNTVTGLKNRGIGDVHLLVEHLDPESSNAFYLDRVRESVASLQVIGDRPNVGVSWPFADSGTLSAIPTSLVTRILAAGRIIKHLAPEIVHANLDWTNVTVGIAALLAGVPKVLVAGRNLAPIHFEFFQWFMYPCYRAMLTKQSVTVLNNSEAGRADYARWLRIDKSRIKVLRNGVRLDEFPPPSSEEIRSSKQRFGFDERTPVVLGAFRFSGEKRPLLWVRAADRVHRKQPSVRFLLCGSGPLEKEIRAAITDHGLGQCVKLLGSFKDMRSAYAASDVVLHAAKQEGTPNVLLEAQSMGIPVVSTHAHGAAESVMHGGSGIVVERDSPQKLGAAVLRIIADEQFKQNARHLGPKFVSERFGLGRMIDEIIAVYGLNRSAWTEPQGGSSLAGTDRHLISGIEPSGGFCFLVAVPQFVKMADGPDNPQQSSLVVLEDGVPLGPGHAPHDSIRKYGRGAYSHWKTALYFSSSDQSDPRTNGRTYELLVPFRTAS